VLFRSAGAGELERAADLAIIAAERASRALAFNHAASLFERALGWAPRRPDVTTLRRRLGEELSRAGRGAEAAEALLSAAAGASPGQALALRTAAGAQLLRSGHVARGMELTREALAARGLRLARTPRGAIASLVWTRARLALRGLAFVPRAEETLDRDELARVDALTATSIGLAALDSHRAADLMGQALLRALALGEPRRVAICLSYETAFAANAGFAGARRIARVREAAEAVAAGLEDPYTRACTLGGAGIASFHLGKLALATRQCAEAADGFDRCPGAVKESFTSRLFGVVALGHAGELGAVREQLAVLLPAARARGDRYVVATLQTGLPNLAWLGADDEARARAELEAARPGLETVSYTVQHFFEFMARVNIELYAGSGHARCVVEEGLPQLDRSLLSRAEWIAIQRAFFVGRAALLAKAPSRVVKAAEAMEARATPWGTALAGGLRAGAHVAQHEPGAAISRLRLAARAADASELALAACCFDFIAAQLGDDVDGQASASARAARLGVADVERMSRVFPPLP
jgi:hypothetical protein